MKYKISEIINIIEASTDCNSQNNFITDIIIDSRNHIPSDKSLFFAICGDRNDGHNYIEQLYKKGVRNFVVSKFIPNIQNLTEACFLKVDNTLTALQNLARNHRAVHKLKVIGIGGSNGKTIIKEWLYQLLCDDIEVVRSPKSYNSQIGVPLSVLQINDNHQLGIFEAGISQCGEMNKLEEIINADIGIFTNIGPAHDENFSSSQQKIDEKLKLFYNVKTLIYCSDYQLINDSVKCCNELKNTKLFTWSKDVAKKPDLIINSVSKKNKQTKISAIFRNNVIFIEIPFTDNASVENAIHCWANMLCMNYENKIIADRMRNLVPVAMRLELKEGINNCSLINDSYNSDINSLKIALDFLNQQKQHNNKCLILSDILQSGKKESELYNEISKMIKKENINHFIGIGSAISKYALDFDGKTDFFLNTDEFIKNYPLSSFSNQTILLKGARIFRFEKINKILQQKNHETVMEINLNALVNNLNYYRKNLNGSTKIMAMVKAFSYGSGSFEIANTLQFHNIDYLTVAYTDEGVELRKVGITSPVLVMNPEEKSFEALIKYDLEAEIYNFRILDFFTSIHKKISNKQKLKIHIKLDTGMHRLGFVESELDELMHIIKNNNWLEVNSIFSHLAAADNSKHDDFTNNQIGVFEKMCVNIQKQLNYPVLRHILNSAGISRFPVAQYDMVRLGIGLYGIGVDENEQKLLDNVSTLKTVISQIKDVNKGESIGYGREWTTSKEMKIATIPIGYADGINRKLGNGNAVFYVSDKAAPTVGNICMDMCMLDISNIAASEGDEVIIFSDKYPLSIIADQLETIPYEILTSISRRVKRIYYHE